MAGAGRSRPSSAAGGGDWVAGRSRSLPRHLDRGGYSREDTADPDDRLLFYLFSKKSVLMRVLLRFRYYSRDFNFESVSLKRQCRTLDRERGSRSRNVSLEADLITIPKVSTEKMRRRQLNLARHGAEEGSRTDTLARTRQAASTQQPHSATLTRKISPASAAAASETLAASLSQSLGSVKNVTIHPEVTHISYNHRKPRYV